MKYIFPILLISMFLSCKGQTLDINNIPVQNPYERDTTGLYPYYIDFEMEYIEDIVYDSTLNNYHLEYNNPDIFDYEEIAEINRAEYQGFVVIDVQSSDVQDLINDYKVKDPVNDEKWIIEKALIRSDEGIKIHFNLQRNKAISD